MRTPLCFIFGFIFLAAGNAFAEDCRIEKQATLPVIFNRFVPTVPVVINGHNVNIGVDTGAEGELITPEAAEQLSLPKDPKHSTRAIGIGADKVNNVLLDLEFAGDKYKEISAAMVSIKSTPTASTIKHFGAEAPMVGLLGTDILSHYDVEYDPANRTLTLYKVTGCQKLTPPWQGGFVKAPASLTSGRRLVIPFALNGHKLTAVFDTGSSGFRLARESAAKAGVTEEMLAADASADGSGIGDHSFKAPLHQFDSLVMPGEEFHGVKIDVVDFPARDADGLIGEDYMKNRRFWLSYSTGAIFVQGSAASHENKN